MKFYENIIFNFHLLCAFDVLSRLCINLNSKMFLYNELNNLSRNTVFLQVTWKTLQSQLLNHHHVTVDGERRSRPTPPSLHAVCTMPQKCFHPLSLHTEFFRVNEFCMPLFSKTKVPRLWRRLALWCPPESTSDPLAREFVWSFSVEGEMPAYFVKRVLFHIYVWISGVLPTRSSRWVKTQKRTLSNCGDTVLGHHHFSDL